MSDIIVVDNVGKKLCRSLRRGLFYGLADLSRSMLSLPPSPQSTLRPSEFWALRNINFSLPKGKTLGVIGNNGSGKTTLLRMMNGIFPLDEGRIEMTGRVAPLISVGAGFHPHLTGRENINLNASILGMSRAEIGKQFNNIVDFAEISDAIDAPVSTYSSGMVVRLGFAIAVHCPLEILLADEVLAVGDKSFQIKCFDKIGQLRDQGVTTLLVTHNQHFASLYSDSILVLDQGRQEFLGPTSEAIDYYNENLSEEGIKSVKFDKNVTGTSDFVVDDVIFSPPIQDGDISISGDQEFSITIRATCARAYQDIEPVFEVAVPSKTHSPFFIASSSMGGKKLNLRKGTNEIVLKIKCIPLKNTMAMVGFCLWTSNKTSQLIYWSRIPLKFPNENTASGWGRLEEDFFVREV